MAKIVKKAVTALMPVPSVMVTSQGQTGKPNIITIAWTGILCNVPPLVYIGVQPRRYSHQLIKDTGEYVINIPSRELLEVTDYCGMVSGRDVDKFEATGLTPVPASVVQVPLIKECPINVECRVQQVLELGSHDVFIAEVVALQADEEVLNDRGDVDLKKIRPFGFTSSLSRQYCGMDDILGDYGLSLKNRKG